MDGMEHVGIVEMARIFKAKIGQESHTM